MASFLDPNSTSPLMTNVGLGLMAENSQKSDNKPIGGAAPNVITSILAESNHPTALIFHFGFRTAALIVYLFFALLVTDSFVFIFVLTVVLLAADFWTVKNVTGRMLVGLRWWSTTATDGTTIWTFETKSSTTNYKPNPTDSRLFWGSLYTFTSIWIMLGLLAILRLNFSWLLVVICALSLNITNLLGYIKCDQDAQTQMMNGIGNSIIGGYISRKVSLFFS